MAPKAQTDREVGSLPPAIGMWLDHERTASNGVMAVRQWQIDDLEQLFREIHADPALAPWTDLSIYADRVTLDTDGFGVDMDGRRSLAIFAREVTVADRSAGGMALFIQDTSINVHFDLRVETFRGSHPFSTVVMGGQGRALPPATDPNVLAYSARCLLSDDLDVLDLGEAGGLEALTLGSPFYWLLVRTFQEAFLAMYSAPETARSQFRWVAANAGLPWAGDANGEMLGLSIQAAAMLARLDRPAHIHYVPRLNLTTELAAIERYAGDAAAIEASFDAYLAVDQGFAERKQTANLFMTDVDKNAEIANQLIRTVDERLHSAEAQLAANLSRFKAQGSGLDETKQEPPGPMAMAQVALEEALERKKEDAVEKASLAVFTAVGSFAAAGADGGTSAVKAASDLSRMAKLVNQIKKITKLLSKVVKALKIVKQIVELIDKVKSDLNQPAAAVQIPTSEESEGLTPTDWAVLKEHWDAGFAPYIEDDILGEAMANYRAEGRILFLYGEAVSNSRQSIIDLETKRAQLAMQLRVYDAQRAKIKAYAEAGEEDHNLYREVSILLREQFFAVKRQLLLRVEDYVDAYRFWALREPTALRSVSPDSSIGSLQRLISAAHADIESALKTFGREAVVVCHISRDIRAELPTVLAWQKAEPGTMPSPSFQIPIDLADPAFRGFDHLRILSVQVLFEGLDAAEANLANGGRRYYVDVSDTGTYADRLTGRPDEADNWSFTAEDRLDFPYTAFVRPLEPHEASDEDSVVNVDPTDASAFLTLQSTQDSSELGGFYNPTPFTTWLLRLSDAEENRGIDWSRVTTVKLRLYGTAMASHAEGL